MGHYDQGYEYEADKIFEAEKAKRLALLQKLDEIRVSASDANIPKRFRNSMEDLQNWLRVKTL